MQKKGSIITEGGSKQSFRIPEKDVVSENAKCDGEKEVEYEVENRRINCKFFIWFSNVFLYPHTHTAVHIMPGSHPPSNSPVKKCLKRKKKDNEFALRSLTNFWLIVLYRKDLHILRFSGPLTQCSGQQSAYPQATFSSP